MASAGCQDYRGRPRTVSEADLLERRKAANAMPKSPERSAELRRITSQLTRVRNYRRDY